MPYKSTTNPVRIGSDTGVVFQSREADIQAVIPLAASREKDSEGVELGKGAPVIGRRQRSIV
jgi:hypothetical protein